MAKSFVSSADFVTALPVFAAADSEALDLALATAECMINLERWGERSSIAHTYLTAHFLAQITGIADGGLVKRKKIDKLELEFMQGTPTDSELGATKWGRMYLTLRGGLFVPPVVGRIC